MTASIEYWFDFVSPYAYIATQSIEQLAAKHGREVEWKPFLLGAVFKTTGSMPLTMRPPVMAAYFRHDFKRSAHYAGVPFEMPTPFPMMSQNTARVFLWVQATAPDKAGDFVRKVTTAYFTTSTPMNDADWLGDFAAGMGLDGNAARAACEDPAYKGKLKALCDEAVARGVFGAPWIVVDGEAFWGNDRLPQVDRYLADGGF